MWGKGNEGRVGLFTCLKEKARRNTGTDTDYLSIDLKLSQDRDSLPATAIIELVEPVQSMNKHPAT